MSYGLTPFLEFIWALKDQFTWSRWFSQFFVYVSQWIFWLYGFWTNSLWNHYGTSIGIWGAVSIFTIFKVHFGHLGANLQEKTNLLVYNLTFSVHFGHLGVNLQELVQFGHLEVNLQDSDKFISLKINNCNHETNIKKNDFLNQTCESWFSL